MKMIKILEEYALLIKIINEVIEYESTEQKIGFRSMSLGTLGATFVGSLLVGNGVIKVDEKKI